MSRPISQSAKAKSEFYSPIKKYLKEVRTQNEIADFMNVSTRNARDEVSLLSKYHAVIRGSFHKGYRLARPIEELTDLEKQEELALIERTISEFNSRIKDMKKTLKPLIAYKKVIEKFIEKKE